MKANTKFNKINPAVLIILMICLQFLGACRSGPETAAKADKPGQAPRRLISDFSGMKENSPVAWVWAKPGFALSSCRSIKIYPLENYSSLHIPKAEEQLSSALQEIFSSAQNPNGRIDAGVMAAVVDLKTKPGLIRRWFPSILDTPCVEIELIIFEESTRTELLKLCHYKKNPEELAPALTGLAEDLKRFFAAF